MFNQFSVKQSGLKLSDQFRLAHKVIFFVPSTYDGNKIAPVDDVNAMVKIVASELARRFGGSRVLPVEIGQWISDSIGLVEEANYPIVSSFVNDVEEEEEFIISLAIFVREEMRQESVFVEIDGIGHII